MPAIQLSKWELIHKLAKVFSLKQLSVVGEHEVTLQFDELSDIRVLEGRRIMVAGDFGKVVSVVSVCDGVYEVCINGVKYKYNGEIDININPLGTVLILGESEED